MPIVPALELVNTAHREGYAVGYFESWNLDSLQGVIDAAEETRSPILIGFNGEFLTHPSRQAEERIGWYAALARAAAESARVPCGLLFNECSREPAIREAIAAGFSLVMLDDPAAPPAEFARRVADLARFAHRHGAAIEAEVGELPCGAAGTVTQRAGVIDHGQSPWLEPGPLRGPHKPPCSARGDDLSEEALSRCRTDQTSAPPQRQPEASCCPQAADSSPRLDRAFSVGAPSDPTRSVQDLGRNPLGIGRALSSPRAAEPVGSEGALTDPAAAARFVETTGIDILAVSVGNVHILLDGERALDLHHLAAIQQQVSVPLDLHGGTGIPPDSLRQAISLGVAKVCYGTYIKQNYLRALRESLAAEVPNPHRRLGMGGPEDLLVVGREAVRAAVLERIGVLGCCGKG